MKGIFSIMLFFRREIICPLTIDMRNKLLINVLGVSNT